MATDGPCTVHVNHEGHVVRVANSTNQDVPFIVDQTPHSESVCAHCRTDNAQFKCGRCGRPLYCGGRCQRADWTGGHKEQCS